MNAMTGGEEPGKEPPIILISFGKTQYYMYKGDEFLNQVLLADGVFPTPILCVHFETVFDARRVIGELDVSQLWGVHPDIVARLRDNKQLVETDA